MSNFRTVKRIQPSDEPNAILPNADLIPYSRDQIFRGLGPLPRVPTSTVLLHCRPRHHLRVPTHANIQASIEPTIMRRPVRDEETFSHSLITRQIKGPGSSLPQLKLSLGFSYRPRDQTNTMSLFCFYLNPDYRNSQAGICNSSCTLGFLQSRFPSFLPSLYMKFRFRMRMPILTLTNGKIDQGEFQVEISSRRFHPQDRHSPSTEGPSSSGGATSGFRYTLF
jgi:hypothetical protein